jgi:thiol-disulfide isomerase/thioredoxin/sugar lactone lactonase YvrE
MKKLWVLMLLLSISSLALAQDATREPREFVGRREFPAPNFPPGLDWLNIASPLRMEDLRGKIVILDFWTYGCINCIHMIPIMEQIEEKYADEVVIIGVHSAKFANEGETENIRQIVRRYELKHPVINDHQFRVWGAYAEYGVQAWPTFVVIDPRGNLLAVQPGEIPFAAFDRVLSGMVEYFDSTGELNREPLELALESDNQAAMALAFPGKVLADAATNRLFISDTNHHRIIVADLLTYEVLDVIGSGERGFRDGGAGEATFDKPQGMALDVAKNLLYVADVNNHAVREVDLAGRRVRTIAGTGEQARGFGQPGQALGTRLASPWDVELGEDGTLFIAMAGPHQLWAMSLADGVVYPFAGSGREGLLDGPLMDAQLAQPSGLHYEDGMLYFADSESSSIRVVDVRAGEVVTLAGPLTNNLFEYGDVDGEVGVSRLQHALGVTAGDDGKLYVADTYNSKIKLLDPETRQITALFGLGGLGGFRDGGPDVAEFDEPGGLDYAAGKLYVADTNNHAVRVIDLSGGSVSTVVFPNPEALQIADRPTVVAGNAAAGLHITLPQQTLAEGEGEIELRINLPDGYKLNDLAPFSSEWVSSSEGIVIAEENLRQSIVEPELPLRVPVTLHAGEDLLHGELTIYYCEAVNESLCFIEQLSIDAPVTIGEGDSTTIVLEHTIVPPVIAASGTF